MNDWIDILNDIADRIYEHVNAGGGILDDDDHNDMMQTIEHAIDDAQFGADDDFWRALQRAKNAMQAWNDEEYPYLVSAHQRIDFAEGADFAPPRRGTRSRLEFYAASSCTSTRSNDATPSGASTK